MPPAGAAEPGRRAGGPIGSPHRPDAEATVPEWTRADAARCVRAPRPDDDKYARGVVGLRTGSERYPGAAVLGVEAAWRTGVGMVRYLGAERPSTLVLQRRPESVTADGRVQAWVIGSGTDAAARAADETAALRAVLAGDVPVVVDAGALDLVPGATAPVVVTPHASELRTLRVALGLEDAAGEGDRATGDGDRVATAVGTAAASGAVVLSKGATTVVATPAGWVRRVDAPTSWLATAGTGDVLAGVVGALVAASPAPVDVEALGPLAATAAWVHGQAALLATQARGGGPITALDVAEALPLVVGALLASR